MCSTYGDMLNPAISVVIYILFEFYCLHKLRKCRGDTAVTVQQGLSLQQRTRNGIGLL